MSMAPQELEDSASRYATDAIRQDSQGARGMAVSNYQKAIDSLVKLMTLYPNNKLNSLYTERTNSYQRRIKALQDSCNIEPAVDPNASSSEQKNNLENQKSRNDFDDLVMKEKPDISWDQVIGLNDAKNALRESIVILQKDQTCFRLDGRTEYSCMDLQDAGKTILELPRQTRLMVIS